MITILAGSYPSFLLSSFKPVHTLKSKWSDTGDSKGIRSGLVVFQFVISSGLIIAMLVVSRQLHYIQNKDVGYDRDQILVMRDSEVPGKEESTFKSILQNDPRVQYVTQSGYVPAGPSNNSMAGIYPDQDSPDFRRTTIYGVDDQYIPTLGMKLIRGRNFSSDYGAEASHVILNETAAKIFGIADDPLGKSIVMATDNKGGRKQLTVIGVVHDFHFRSLHQVIDPMIMLYNPNGGLIVRAKTSDMAGLIASAKKEWTKLSSGEPFTYALLDDLYNKTYVADQKVGDVLEVFTLLTIFVACLGLFGLVTFTAEQKFKEIGIRKVLGSTVSQVVILLTKDLIKLVLISFFVAFPLGYYLMKWWLQDFAYRIEIQWWFFAAAGMITLLIAFITMSLKTVRSALVNPVDSIRDE